MVQNEHGFLVFWGDPPAASSLRLRAAAPPRSPLKGDSHGRLLGIETRVIYGDPDTLPAQLGVHTAYIEHTHLTMRHMNGRLVRKSLGFSKRRTMLEAACTWEDAAYNFARHVKTLRLEVNDGFRRWLYRSPAMAAGLADRIWSIEDLLLTIPVPTNS